MWNSSISPQQDGHTASGRGVRSQRRNFLMSIMSKILLCILYTMATASASTFWVASGSSVPVGSDLNAGTQAAPWLTVDHALNHSAFTCGDTLMVVVDGHFVAGDVNLPYFANCGATSTIQSSALAQFAPIGYRTNPANDSANYGKLSFTSNGIVAAPKVVSFNTVNGAAGVSFNTSTNTVTVSTCSGCAGIPYIANGLQVEFEPQYEGMVNVNFPNIVPPTGLSFLTHYCVSNSSGAGAPNATFQLKAADCSGSALTLSGCTVWCSQTVTADPSGSCMVGTAQFNTSDFIGWTCPAGTWTTNPQGPFIAAVLPLSVNTSTSVFTMPNNYGTAAMVNNQALAFGAAGYQLYGTLPAPLQLDTRYYATNVSGLTFQVSLVPGGSPLTITSVGTGWVSVSSTDLPNNWLLDGLELSPNGTSVPFTILSLGQATESSTVGMVHHIELRRSYIHDNPPTAGIVHAIFENGRYFTLRDSWVIGANDGEAQAYSCVGSPGPTLVVNNFMEASGEVSLCGGSWPASGVANANKLFQGNYFYKPPVWRITEGSGVTPSGACLYDTTDPTHSGGEYYFDTGTSTGYQCQPNGTWNSSLTVSIPTYFTTACGGGACSFLKDMTEGKNEQYFAYIGNLYNGSYTLNGSRFSNSQNGEVWNNSMEYGSGPGAANDHITVMHNAAYNSYVFQTRTSQCGYTNAVCPVVPGSHVTQDNLMVVNPLVCGVGFLRAACQVAQAPQANAGISAPYFNGDYWNHNTIFSADSFPGPGVLGVMSYNDPQNRCPIPTPYNPIPINLVTYLNSIVPGDLNNQCGDAGNLYYSNSTFANNIFKGGTSASYSPGNMAPNTFTPLTNAFPTSNSTIGYVSPTGMNPLNYGLSSSSGYGAASGCTAFCAGDGTDLGIDPQVVTMWQYGAQSGVPTPTVQVSPGSTTVLLNFTAPTTTTCTANIYPFPGPRNASTLIGSGTDTISNGLTKEIDFGPTGALTASATFWDVETCANGWIHIGTFTMPPTAVANGIWSVNLPSSQTWKLCTDVALTAGCSTQIGTSLSFSIAPGVIRYIGPSSGTAIQGVTR